MKTHCTYCGIEVERILQKKATCFDCKVKKQKGTHTTKKKKVKQETVEEWFIGTPIGKRLHGIQTDT